MTLDARVVAGIPEIRVPTVRSVLRCGAVLLVSRRPDAPVTSVHIHVRGGPAFDPAGREGTAFLAGRLADQGTGRHSEEEIAEMLEPAGGEISGDATGLSGTIVRDGLELLLDLLCDILTSPSYPAEPVARQKQRLLDRLTVERDDPRTQGGLLFRKLVYGDHWLGRAPYGTIDSVRRIGARDLRAHHAKNWVARRAVIAVCGDIDAEEVRKILDRKLARWTSGEPLVTTPPQLPERAVRTAVFPADRQQVHVYMGHLGIRRSDPDYASLVVMDHVLGTGPGFTNRISRRLRDELGLAYTVTANIHGSAGNLPGMFTAYIGTSPKHVATAVQGFVAEIRRIQTDLVESQELETAKSYLLGSFPLSFERSSHRANFMTASEVFGFPPDHLQRLLRQFAAVDAEEVRRVAQKHLFPTASCIAATGPIRRAELEKAYRSACPRV